MTKNIVLTPLLIAEIPYITKELQHLAHIGMTESEFRKIILEKKVFKATVDYTLFGVIAITAKPLAEITIWLSEKETKETWAEAIDKTVSRAFLAPEVYKIKWLIAESGKEMIAIAQECGFKEEGKFQDEGPNRESLISFGLSRNGNRPNPFFKQISSAEETSFIKDELEEKILFLEAKLKETEELNESLQKSLLEIDEKRRVTENELLLLKEKVKKPCDPEEKTAKTKVAVASEIQERLETGELEKFITQKLGVIAEHTNRNRLQKLIRLIEIVAQTAANEKITKEKLQTQFACSPATIENLLKILRDAEIIKIGREKIGGKSLAIIRLTEITAAELESIKKVQEITKKPPLADEKQPEIVQIKDEDSRRQPQEPEKTKDEAAKPEVQEQKNETSAWNKNSATVYIDKQQTEKAKRLLKANLKREKNPKEEGLSAIVLLKELNLPCNKEVIKKLAYFIGSNFAFIEGSVETDFENCKIKIQENVANAIKRGNALIETIIKEGKQKGEEKEWQINFEALCEKMKILGYDNPEKIKKSIKFLRNDPELGYTIQTPYTQKGVLDNNNIIILTRL